MNRAIVFRDDEQHIALPLPEHRSELEMLRSRLRDALKIVAMQDLRIQRLQLDAHGAARGFSSPLATNASTVTIFMNTLDGTNAVYQKLSDGTIIRTDV